MTSECYDVRFRHPATFLLAGASQSGKTHFAFNLLRKADVLFNDPRCTQNIIYYYKQWQDSFEMFENENIVTKWINGKPTADDFTSQVEKYKDNGGSIVILDDFGQEITKDFVLFFTVLAHHTSTSVILLTQNIFSKNPLFRELSLNTNIIVFFKNPRDNTQISHLARQISPTDSKYIIEAYRAATKKPYSYLLFDLTQQCAEEIRVRSGLFEKDSPISVWMSKKKI